MYTLKNKQPYNLVLFEGVELNVKPITSALMLKVQSEMPPRAEDQNEHDWYILFVKQIAANAINSWSGIGDVDGNLAEVNYDNVSALLDDYQIFTEFQSKYLSDYESRQAEKNA